MPFGLITYREQNEEDVFHNPSPTCISYSHRATPRIPVFTFLHLFNSPAAKAFTQIKPAVSLSVATIPRLQIRQPIAHDINEGRNASAQYTCGNEDKPNLTCVRQLLDMTQDTARASVQVAQSLALLGILEDPVYGREVVVAHATAGPFHVPVQAGRILGIFRVVACVAGSVEVVEDELCGVVGMRGAAAKLLEARVWGAREGRRAQGSAERGGEKAREAEGRGGRGFLFTLERDSGGW